MLAVLAVYPGLARANPSDGQVVAGSADISSSNKTLTIQQNSARAVIDWRNFDIAPDETTRFIQPDSNAAVLNRVRSNDPSVIAGQLQANGHVILVNPNGVLFDSTSKVDVNGLLATTADIENDAFMAGSGNFNKPGNPAARIENRGSITAAEAGLVGLVAPQVINSGTISARLGRVQLSSGDSVTIDLYGDGLLEVKASDALHDQLVDNSGSLRAEGGTIALTAAAARDTVNAVVKVGGELKATTVGQRQGRIVIAAEGSHAVSGNVAEQKDVRSGNSTVLVTGRLDVSGKDDATATGGSARVTADHIALLQGSSIDASGNAGGGTVLVGGDYLGQGDTPTARATIMQAGASIDASARDEGHGGKVIVYADDYTDFAGDIDASGNGESGNGGLVETSGHYALVASGNVRVRSGRKGLAGQWLLDPADVTLTTATTNNSGAPSFTPTGSGSQINVATIVSSLNAGTNVTIATSNDGYAGNGDITVSSSITSTGSGALTLSAYRNINVNTGITLNGGALTLRADNTGIGSGAIGIGGAIATNGGNITIGGGSGAITAGSGYAYGNSTRVVGIDTSSTINAGGGNIIFNGRGYTTTTDNNYGIRASGLISTSGTGTISLNGIGGGSGASSNNFAVYLQAGVTTANGDITVNATGGSSATGGNNYGAVFSSSGGYARITGTGNISVTGSSGTGTGGSQQGVVINYLNALQTTTGNITVNGTGSGAGTGGSGYGVVVGGSVAASVTSAGGAISITGTSTNTSTGASNHGVYVGAVAGTSITNTGSGSITLNGTAGGGTPSSGNNGINIANGAAISTVNGALSLTGVGGGGGSGSGNHGIALAATGASITTSGSGSITLNGTSGNASGSGGASMGVYVNAANAISTSGSGNIAITGTSVGSGTKTSGGNHGITLSKANSVTTSGSGNISMTGYGAQSTGTFNYGISFQSSSSIGTTGTGNTTLTGYGGNGNSGDNNGIVFDNGYASATGASTITVYGYGGGSGNASNSRGIYFANGGYITSSNGSISLTGTGGGSGSGANSSGIYFIGSNSRVYTTGSGNITLSGTGGNSSGTGGGNHGLQIETANAITTSGTGSISLSGAKGGQSSSYGISTAAATTNAAATTGTAGNIGVYSDTISLGNPGAGNYVFNAVGTLTLAPLTTITMGVGSGSGTLSYTDTLLGYMAAGAYTFGSVTSDEINIATTKDFGDRNLSFISSTNVNLASSLTKSSGTGTANYLLQANNQITNTSSAGISATSGKINLTFNADYDRATTPGGRVSLAGGTFNTNGGNIVMGGGTNPLTDYIYSSVYSAISLSSSNVLNAGAGSITMRGENGGSSSLVAVSLQGAISTTSGAINIYGLSNTTGSVSRSILLNGPTAAIQTGSGHINITGSNTSGIAGNYAFLIYNTGTSGSTISSTSGHITIDTSRGSNEASFGLVTSNVTTSALQTTSGNITLLADTIYNASSSTQFSANGGTLTIAPKTGVTMAVGPTTGGSLILPTALLGQMSAASYVFGSTVGGNLTINTTRDFGNSNVSFLSGGNITLAGSLTKASGTGTAAYLLQANGNISNSGNAGIIANNGKIDLTINPDYDQSTSIGGSVSFVGGTINTNGGNVVIGGGTSPLTQNAYNAAGTAVFLNNTITTGAGNINIRGEMTGTTSASAVNIYGSLLTTSGNISIFGKADSTTLYNHVIFISGAAGQITTGSGNITITGHSNSGVSGNKALTLYNSGASGTNITSTSGNILLDLYRTAGSGGVEINTTNTTTPAISTASGNITIYTDAYYSSSSGTQISAPLGTVTFAPRTAGTTVSVGPTSGSTLNLATAFLNQMVAASYVFGSTTTGNLTINTTRDFGNSNVSLLSGGNITLASSLTKASGTGTAAYLLQANGNISNSGSAGIVASSGLINLVLTSDYDISGSGNIALTSAPLNVNGGTITLTSNGQSITQSGSIGGNETINSGNGAVSIGVLDGDSAGTRSLSVNAGTATFTTTGIIGGTAKLNNLSIVSNDVALGAAMGGSGTLTLQPYSDASEIRINSATAGGTYSLSSTELSYFTDGWAGIEIGKSTGSGSIYIGTTSWNDPITFRNNYRTQMDNPLTASGNASVTFNVGTSGWINTYGGITTAGQNVSFLGGSTLSGAHNITTNGGNISVSGNTSVSAGVAISPTWSTSGGNITFTGTLQRNTSGGSVASRTFTLNTGTGSITFNSTVNGDYSLSATAASLSFNGAWGASEALGSVSLTSTASLSLPSITATGIMARTTAGTADITLGSGKLLSASGSGTAITLAAGRNFINSSGSSTPLATTGGGRWLVYATSPAGNTLGGMTSNFVRYSCTYAGSCPSFSGSGNGLLYTYTPTLTATPRAVSLTYGDAAPSMSGYSYDLSGYLTSAAGADASSDSVTGTLTGTTGYTQGSNIGSYGISYSSGTLTSALGYGFTYASNSSAISVDPRTLTIALTGSTSKTYSGTTAATLSAGNYSLSGLYGSDSLGVSYTSAAYDDANVGTGKTVTASGLSISGTKAGNYTLASTTAAAAIGEVTRKGVIVTADNKSVTYGDSLPALTASYSGFVSGEDETVLTTAATIASGTAGTADVGTYTGTLTASGASADNYSFSYVDGNLTITPRALTVSTDAASYSGTGALPTLTGSNTLLAADASRISWVYAAPGYAGLAGVYTITATATDPDNRLANYTRTNSYGNLTVAADSTPPIPPISASVEALMAAGPRLPTVIVVSTPAQTSESTSNQSKPQVITVAGSQLASVSEAGAIAGNISITPELSSQLKPRDDD